MTFDGVFTEEWIRRFADSVFATESELTELDQQAGDGDFGVNLSRGLASALQALDRLSPTDLRTAADPLAVTGTVFLDEVGGTSGPLFGLFFEELAVSAQRAGPVLTRQVIANGTEAGLEAIQRVGEAVPGDKTLVDALAPACQEIRRCDENASPDQVLIAAARGAWEGVRNTALSRARQGRASYLGDRVSGVPDPGAVGMGLLFSSAERKVPALGPLLADSGQDPDDR